MYNHQLETFIAVADNGSFTKAADKLFISPTAVIKQINILESSLDLKLFNRTHRGLTLTAAGKSLYSDARYLISYANDSLARARSAMQEENNIIRIGTSPMTPAQILVELWPKIHELYPELRFKLVPFENTPENAREILLNLGQNIDMVAGIFDNALLSYRQCDGLILFNLPICCACAVNSPLAQKEQLEITDLYGQNLLLIRRGWMDAADKLRDYLLQNYPQIKIIDFDFYSTDIFNRCANENLLLASLPIWQNVHPLLKTLPVNWDFTMPYGLMHSPQPSAHVQKFITALQKLYHTRHL